MRGKNKALPDTNVVLRYLLQDNKEQFEEAEQIFDTVREGAIQAVFSGKRPCRMFIRSHKIL